MNLDVSSFSIPINEKVCLVSIHSDKHYIFWKIFMETTKQLVGNSISKHLINKEINKEKIHSEYHTMEKVISEQ